MDSAGGRWTNVLKKNKENSGYHRAIDTSGFRDYDSKNSMNEERVL